MRAIYHRAVRRNESFMRARAKKDDDIVQGNVVRCIEFTRGAHCGVSFFSGSREVTLFPIFQKKGRLTRSGLEDARL